MKQFFESFLLIALCLIGSNALAVTQPVRIAVFGDSLTSGYRLSSDENFVYKLERKLRQVGYSNIKILDMTSKDQTSTDAAKNVSAVLGAHPDIVLVEIGENDIERQVNSDILYNNLKFIISNLQQQGMYVIVMGIKAPASLGYVYASEINRVYYNAMIKGHAQQLYPSTLEGIAGHQNLTLADGVHPSAGGVDVMVEGVYRMVDSGLRWKWQVDQMHKYQEQLENTMMRTQ